MILYRQIDIKKKYAQTVILLYVWSQENDSGNVAFLCFLIFLKSNVISQVSLLDFLGFPYSEEEGRESNPQQKLLQWDGVAQLAQINVSNSLDFLCRM